MIPANEEIVTTGASTDGRFSRAQLLKAAGLGFALAAMPGAVAAQSVSAGAAAGLSFPYFPQVTGTYTPEEIRDMLDMLVTMERFVVANVTASLQAPIAPGLAPLHVPIEQASVVAALAHVTFLESLGAQTLTDTFTIGVPPTESSAALQRKELITTIFIGAYLAAAREFAELGQPVLAKYAFQIGAGHAEHRAMARVMQALEGTAPGILPTNKAFETDLFLYVRDAYSILSALGLFGTAPVKLTYPTTAEVMAAAGPMANLVVQTMPNNASSSVIFKGPASILAPRA
jgi:hypothetical protein